MQRIICILVFLIFQIASFSQDSIDVKELKVGLVLSGGGAKGLAHIGALKVIEEAGVKIDYIGGTSIGAIIGALYASGYSANKLDSIFRTTDFVSLVKDIRPRNTKTFYEKKDAEKYALTLPLIDFKITVPRAISSGQNVYNELVRLLYHVRDITNFNNLPIPFLCIATDVETGEEILLNKGYLPEVIIASGTLPLLFELTEINGRLLLDGGVINNYPVEEVRNLGADIIIGVDVQHSLLPKESLSSATDIILQINKYRTAKDIDIKSVQTDIYIKPDMSDYSVMDFGLSKEIVQSGVSAARGKFTELSQLSKNQKWNRAEVNTVNEKDSILVSRLLVTGNINYTKRYIKGKLKFDLEEKITFKRLNEGINNLSATGNFKTIRHKLVSNDNGVDLILKLKEDPNKYFVRMGIHYDDLYSSSALVNLTHKNLLTSDDVGSFDFIIGDNIRYNMNYRIDRGDYWSFGINSIYDEFEKEIGYSVLTSNFDALENPNINTVNFKASDLTNQIYIHTSLKQNLTISLGLEHKFLKYSTKTLGILENDVPLNSRPFKGKRTFFDKSNYYSTYARLISDTYNDKYFPSKGSYFEGDFHFYMFSSDFVGNFKAFSIGKVKTGAAFSLFPKLSFNVEAEFGFKLGISKVKSLDFVLGGFGNKPINNFTPFFGYDFLSIPGNSYVKTYTGFDYVIQQKNHLLFAVNLANVDDDLFRLGDWFEMPNYSGYAIGYGLESLIGPVQIMYSWSPEENSGYIYFSVGFWF